MYVNLVLVYLLGYISSVRESPPSGASSRSTQDIIDLIAVDRTWDTRNFIAMELEEAYSIAMRLTRDYRIGSRKRMKEARHLQSLRCHLMTPKNFTPAMKDEVRLLLKFYRCGLTTSINVGKYDSPQTYKEWRKR